MHAKIILAECNHAKEKSVMLPLGLFYKVFSTLLYRLLNIILLIYAAHIL